MRYVEGLGAVWQCDAEVLCMGGGSAPAPATILPTPAPPPPAPVLDQSALNAAQKKQTAASSMRSGRVSTILTNSGSDKLG